MTREEMILSRVRTEIGLASVCNDDYLSYSVSEQMLKVSWPLQENAIETEILKQDSLLLPDFEFTGIEERKKFDTPEYVLPPKLGCDEDLEEVSQNKDIMWKIPQKTKLRPVKRLINRILRLTNRYQQDFNNAVFRILKVLTGTLEWVKDGLIMTDDKANRALNRGELLDRALNIQEQQLGKFGQGLELVKDGLIKTDDRANRALNKGELLDHALNIQERRLAEFERGLVVQRDEQDQRFSEYQQELTRQRDEQEQKLAEYGEELTYQKDKLTAIEKLVTSLPGIEMTIQKLENLIKEQSDLQNSRFELQKEIHALQSDKMELQRNKLDDYIETNKNKMDTLQNQSGYCAETLGAQNYQIEQAKKKLEELQNQSNYNSEELVKQNYRLGELERKSEHRKYGLDSNMISDGASSGYYSQSGEDSIVDYIIERCQIALSKVTYLDLGANHAKYLSNTYYFYKNKGKGVLVEANPELISELEQHRKGDVILNRCIAEKSGEKVRFYITSKDGLSSVSLDSVKDASQTTPEVQVEKTVEIEAISVNDIFRDYFEAPPTFVSMDLEGIEMNILNSIDFDTYRPLIFIIETIPYRAKLVIEEKENDIVDFMKSKGYVEYAFTGINSIFVDERQIEKQ